jgi:hypothetical protein
MCLASCPNRPRPRRRPSSSAVIRVVRVKLPPLALSMHPSSIRANPRDPQPTRTNWGGWDNSLSRYRQEAPGVMRKIAVPGERLKGSRLRLEANKGWIFGLDPPDFDCPSGTGLSASLPRHFVPGYYHPVPPGQKPFAHRRPRIKLARMGR